MSDKLQKVMHARGMIDATDEERLEHFQRLLDKEAEELDQQRKVTDAVVKEVLGTAGLDDDDAMEITNILNDGSTGRTEGGKALQKLVKSLATGTGAANPRIQELMGMSNNAANNHVFRREEQTGLRVKQPASNQPKNYGLSFNESLFQMLNGSGSNGGGNKGAPNSRPNSSVNEKSARQGNNSRSRLGQFNAPEPTEEEKRIAETSKKDAEFMKMVEKAAPYRIRNIYRPGPKDLIGSLRDDDGGYAVDSLDMREDLLSGIIPGGFVHHVLQETLLPDLGATVEGEFHEVGNDDAYNEYFNTRNPIGDLRRKPRHIVGGPITIGSD
jgi:hypothetical protein